MSSESTLQLPLDFPIPTLSDSDHPTAKIILDRLSSNNQIYVLTFSNPPDNRLTPSLITPFINTLDVVEKHVPRSALLVTISSSLTPKFYSNGFVLMLNRATHEFHRDYWNKFLIRLLTLPIPTIALVRGHAIHASTTSRLQSHESRDSIGELHPFQLAKGWLCMNKVEFGGELTPSMASTLRKKLDARTYGAAVLEAHRFTGTEALSAGIVDPLGHMTEVEQLIKDKKLIGKGSKGVFGLLRDEMYMETMRLLERYPNKAGTQRDDKEKLGQSRWSKL